ncbi:MAG: hypothetical protein JNL69_03315 [Bacteroidia bacterium]|nr:hypothetical protein [Bacteroidia bacterium]
MSKKTYKLSKKNSNIEIQLNPEQAFMKALYIKIPSLTDTNIEEIKKQLINIKIHATLKYNTNQNDINVFIGSIEGRILSIYQKTLPIDKILTKNQNSEIGDSVTIYYQTTNNDDLELEIVCDLMDRNVSVEGPFSSFKNHIEQKDNVKILFSSPFGQGKSTFLNYFFEENAAEYDVFKVYPVNYSISHNEDIFKYIKTELLTQLFSKDIEFDKESFSYFHTLPQFFLNNPYRILSPLISLIPKIGKSAREFSDAIYGIAKEYFEFHEKLKIDDKQKAEHFISELYEKEGSVFEDNFYTQLIRQQLEKLKIKNNRKNVLIIEDLDRIDPDHIFRILNVFAAHFDDSDKYNGYSNKFGFDKIILVGDYHNIKNVYEYRYGPKVKFDGYINKYYSTEPFIYNNIEAIKEIIGGIRKTQSIFQQNIVVEILTCIIEDLVSTNGITLRDLLKLQKNDIYLIFLNLINRNYNRSKEFYPQFPFFIGIHYLTKLFDPDTLVSKLEECKHNVNSSKNFNHSYFASIGLPSLVLNINVDHHEARYKLKNYDLKFTIIQHSNPNTGLGFYDINQIHNIVGGQATPVTFNKKDFYDILILNTKKFKEVGGFD